MTTARTSVTPRASLRIALSSIVLSALVSVPGLSDPRQAARAAICALAAASILTVSRTSAARCRPDERAIVVTVAALVLACGLVVSAVVNGVASSLYGVHGRYQGLVSWAMLFVVACAGLRVGKDATRVVARVAALAALVESIVVIAQLASRAGVTGSMGNPVIVGSWLATAAAMAAAAAIAERERSWRALLVAASGVSVLALGIVGSRGAWVGVLAGGITALIASRKRRGLFAVALLAAVFLIVAGALATGGEAREKLDVRLLGRGSAAARLEIWRGTLALIADEPLLGVGPGRFLYAFPRYEPVEHARIEGPDVRADQAHGLLLQTAAEAGIPAAVALTVILGAALSSGIAGARVRDAGSFVALVGLAAFTGQALFGVYSSEVYAFGALLVGMLLGGSGGKRHRAREDAAGPSEGWSGSVRVGLSGLAFLAAFASLWWMTADASYTRGLAAFERQDLAVAAMLHERAIARIPMDDVYRVALADGALFERGALLQRASRAIDEGLRLEPASFDLALARARVLRAAGADPGEVARAYARAAMLYPRGVAVRREAIIAMSAAGRSEDAVRLAHELSLVVPEDPIARSVLDGK